MDPKHFDALIRSLAPTASRRGLLAMVFGGLLVALPAWSDETVIAGKKRHNKRGKHGRKRPYHPPKRPKGSSCSGGACLAHFTTPADRDYCEFICRQCDGEDPRDFCIVEGNLDDPAKVAVCCPEGRECCGGLCCGAGDYRCCGGKCVNLRVSVNHCGGCNQPCTGGRLCVDRECHCPDGQLDCHGVCVAGNACPDDGGGGCPDGYVPHPCQNLYPAGSCIAKGNDVVCCADFVCQYVEGDPATYFCCGTADDNTYSCKQPGETCRVDVQYPNLGYHRAEP